MKNTSVVTSSLSYTPTLCLKRVNPESVLEAYLRGQYLTATLPTTKRKLKATFIPATTGESLMFRDKNNCIHTIHMTNNTKIKQLPVYSPRCYWCMQELSKDVTQRVPIVCGMSQIAIKDGYKYTFLSEGEACSFECALAYLRHFGYGVGASARTSHQVNGEMCLHALYRLIYPDGDELIEAPDFRLLVNHGGTMSVDEFIQCKHVYIPSPVVSLQPVSHQFMSVNNK
jgi:hypothetical protein